MPSPLPIREPHIARFIGKFLKDEDGTTKLEYAITLALIGMSIAAAATVIGHSMAGNFGGLEKEMRSSQSFESYFQTKAKPKRPSDSN